MTHISSEIRINASKQQVWNILADLGAIVNFHPFILKSYYTSEQKEGVEAAFFRTPDEMITKIKKYLNNDDLRAATADAGFKCVYQDGHDIVSRMRSVIDLVEKM